MGQTAAKQHEQRVTRCLQSFAQLQADVRHINAHCAPEFARVEQEGGEPMVLHFKTFTKLKKRSSVPWLWKINDNVVVMATILTAKEAEAIQAKASSAAATPQRTPVAAPAVAPPVVQLDSSALAVAAPSAASAAPTVTPAAADPSPSPSPSPCYTLTLREFYFLFLHFVDTVRNVTTLREQILKIEQPAVWAAKQEARRREALARARKGTAGGPAEQEEEEKSSSVAVAAAATTPGGSARAVPGLAVPSLSRETSLDSDGIAALVGTVPNECSICLSAPEEEAMGEELVVLSCLHSFCAPCITEWRAHSATCPLCRRDLEADAEENDDSWILTSPNLSELRSSFTKAVAHPFAFVRQRPPFPPPGGSGSASGSRRSALKHAAGDAISFVAGEAIDALTEVTGAGASAKQRKQSAGAAGGAQPVNRVAAAAAAAVATEPAVSSQSQRTDPSEEKAAEPPLASPPPAQVSAAEPHV